MHEVHEISALGQWLRGQEAAEIPAAPTSRIRQQEPPRDNQVYEFSMLT